MGVNDFKQLLANRKNLYLKLKQDLQALAARYVFPYLFSAKYSGDSYVSV
jgi:hypothetical protein